MKLNQAIKEVDTLHTSEADYKEKAKQKFKDILAWLYLVIHDEVESVQVLGCPSALFGFNSSSLFYICILYAVNFPSVFSVYFFCTLAHPHISFSSY